MRPCIKDDTLSQARRLVAGADAIFLDWDGCLAQGGRLVPGARRLLSRAHERVSILSNNSTHLPEDLAAFLRRDGVTLPTDRIFLAGHQTVNIALCDPADRPVYLLSNDRMRAYAERQNLTLGRDGAETVLLLRDTDFSYARLATAANLVRRGARLIVANPDPTHPGDNGAVVPETGALLAALAACADLSRVDMEVVGKPSRHLFDVALQRRDTRPDRAVMIGDTAGTDCEGAARAGIRSILLDQRAGITIAALAEAVG